MSKVIAIVFLLMAWIAERKLRNQSAANVCLLLALACLLTGCSTLLTVADVMAEDAGVTAHSQPVFTCGSYWDTETGKRLIYPCARLGL